MKKRALAILMILVLATAGLFAGTIDPLVVIGNGNQSVVATLNATIGQFLHHGFTTGNGSPVNGYYSTITVSDAFNTTAPTFTYGYKTNASSGTTYTFNMEVLDFTNGTSGTVKIQQVKVGGGSAASQAGRVFEVLKHVGNGVENTASKTIQIIPFQTSDGTATDIVGSTVLTTNAIDQAPPGSYTSTVTFSIVTS
ncbi:MAG TPA: hypothetical protein VJ863_08195 [Sphaerochaeta sp.]|nr:hypothetical protein [Sphaerochaeta sp.]